MHPLTKNPKISFVVTLYNKEDYIHNTALSLIGQTGNFDREYLFIDDNSTDNSVSALEDTVSGIRNVRIIRTSENRGPSVRLNQAAQIASGDFLFFFDSDDLLLPGAVDLMLKILEATDADFIHGKHSTDKDTILTQRPSFQVIDNPCTRILKSRPLTLVSCLVKKEVFLRAGGCDDSVFIQDISLNLRLACASKRLVDLADPIMIRLEPEQNLTQTGGSTQSHHDGFFSFRNFAKAKRNLPDGRRFAALANRRATSYGWKAIRKDARLLRKIGLGFLYLLSRSNHPILNEIIAARFERIFAEKTGIRKPRPLTQPPQLESTKSNNSKS